MATRTNSPFFDFFPKIQYDVNYGKYPINVTATDIFFRIGMIKDTLQQISSYYVYEIADGETPEILADKFYDDVGAGWMIIYANNIMDPQWDWPLDYNQFNNYIIGKYGSIENAKLNNHHYEKVVTRTNTNSDVISESRFIIDEEKIVDGRLNVPYNYYQPYDGYAKYADNTVLKADTDLVTADSGIEYEWKEGSLPEAGFERVISFGNSIVTEEVLKLAISNYDYENQINESKRTIKVIRKDYYSFIMRQFKVISYEGDTSLNSVSFLRRLAI
jgi:hypothetical protein